MSAASWTFFLYMDKKSVQGWWGINFRFHCFFHGHPRILPPRTRVDTLWGMYPRVVPGFCPLMTSRLMPSRLMPSRLMSSRLIPSRLIPSRLTPSRLIPSRLIPSRLIPSRLIPSRHLDIYRLDLYRLNLCLRHRAKNQEGSDRRYTFLSAVAIMIGKSSAIERF